MEGKAIVKWALQHPGEWAVITGGDSGPLTPGEFERIARLLLRENFFDAYYILYTRFGREQGITPFAPPGE